MARHERLVDVVGGEGDDELFGRFCFFARMRCHDPSAIAATSSAGADHGRLVGSIVAHHLAERVERRLYAVGVQRAARREGDGSGRETSRRRCRGTPIR